MKGIQNNKAHKTDKQFPGCLGRMVNLLDLSAAVPANRLLMDKPHRAGSLVKSRSDVARILGSPAGNKLDDKLVYPDLRSLPIRNSHSTPMKTLIAEEMLKEIKSEHRPPNLVAKLMGLDSLPCKQHGVAKQIARSKDYPHHILSHSGEPTQHWQQEHGFLDKRMKWKAREYEDHGDYRDVYEVRDEYKRTNTMRQKSPRRGPYSEKEMKRMELVHQKFMEAKRLAANEKLCQSKEFQDAVEVLSSNKDFFLKFLEEPSALISKNLYELECSCAPPETKRITVLKPSKMIDLEKFPARGKKNEYPINMPAQVVQERYPCSDVDECANEPTRIVVLKPDAGRMCEIKSSVSVSSTSPGILHGENTFEAENYRTVASREVVEENIFHMHRKLMGDQRDEALMSSAFWDKTSSNRSEHQHALESFNDFEVVSPRHSWDCINGVGSPFSSSSFSRTSHSSDSLVCREAKKHLSERWAMTALVGPSQEGRHSSRSSNTLGEMLALSDTKKYILSSEEGNGRGVCTTGGAEKGDAISVPVNFQRSRSLPASSVEHGQRIHFGQSAACKINSLEHPTKKSVTSSFKGKVSSFFFPRNKRSSKDKCFPTQSAGASQSAASDIPEPSVSAYHDGTHYVNLLAEDHQFEECSSPGLGFSSISFPNLSEMGKIQGRAPKEEVRSNLITTAILGNSIENPDQPSPISVLELPYEEDDTATPESSGKQLPIHPPMSSLINKSPRIQSIARTLSWDNSSSGSASPDPSEPASHELVEQDWLLLTRKILSAAGIDGEARRGAFPFNWHSLESPLDPSLREKLANTDEELSMHGAKRRQQRSNRKLVCDCVNEALVKIMCHSLEPMASGSTMLLSGKPSSTMLDDQVCALVREWMSHKVEGDEHKPLSLAVEMAVREEVVVGGGWWVENFSLEMDHFGKEIERELLRELVNETLGLICLGW